MFLVVTSHTFLLPVPLGWPQSCLFHTHSLPITALHPQVLTEEYGFLISSPNSQPIATPWPRAPQSLPLMSLPSPSQSSTCYLGSAVSVLPLSNLILHLLVLHFLAVCCPQNSSASILPIISFLILQSQFPYPTSPR